MRSLLLGLLLASSASAAVQDVNVTNTFVPAKQYGIWGINVDNFPAQYSVTQGGLFSVNQNGVWSVGQYGPWSVALAPGTTVTVQAPTAGLLITTNAYLPVSIKSSVNLTVTAGAPFPVSIVAGTTGGSNLAVSATSSIPFTGGTSVGQVVLSNGFFFDSVAGVYRQLRAANAVDPTSSNAHPGTVGYGVYNAVVPTLTNGTIARHQMDTSGNLMVGTRSGIFGVDARGSSTVAYQGGSWTFSNSGGMSVTNPALAAVQIAGSITNTVTVGTHAVTISAPTTGQTVNVSNTVTVTGSLSASTTTVEALGSTIVAATGIQTIFSSGKTYLWGFHTANRSLTDAVANGRIAILFDGAVTKTAISLQTDYSATWPRPMVFTTNMVINDIGGANPTPLTLYLERP